MILAIQWIAGFCEWRNLGEILTGGKTYPQHKCYIFLVGPTQDCQTKLEHTNNGVTTPRSSATSFKGASCRAFREGVGNVLAIEHQRRRRRHGDRN